MDSTGELFFGGLLVTFTICFLAFGIYLWLTDHKYKTEKEDKYSAIREVYNRDDSDKSVFEKVILYGAGVIALIILVIVMLAQWGGDDEYCGEDANGIPYKCEEYAERPGRY